VCEPGNSTGSVKKAAYALFCLTIFWHGNGFCEQLSDPTRPPGTQIAAKRAGTKAAPRWILSSTLIAPTRRLAIINGKTVTVGEKVGGAEVMRIEPARVSLQEGGKQLVLKLAPRDYKRMR
jgi:MSHA biogenesis protein MshK